MPKKTKARRTTKTAGIYYVGAPEDQMTPGWAKTSLQEAVAHAEKLLNNQPRTSEVRIVKVVAYVRRQSTPIKVEKI